MLESGCGEWWAAAVMEVLLGHLYDWQREQAAESCWNCSVLCLRVPACHLVPGCRGFMLGSLALLEILTAI